MEGSKDGRRREGMEMRRRKKKEPKGGDRKKDDQGDGFILRKTNYTSLPVGLIILHPVYMCMPCVEGFPISNVTILLNTEISVM